MADEDSEKRLMTAEPSKDSHPLDGNDRMPIVISAWVIFPQAPESFRTGTGYQTTFRMRYKPQPFSCLHFSLKKHGSAASASGTKHYHSSGSCVLRCFGLTSEKRHRHLTHLHISARRRMIRILPFQSTSQSVFTDRLERASPKISKRKPWYGAGYNPRGFNALNKRMNWRFGFTFYVTEVTGPFVSSDNVNGSIQHESAGVFAPVPTGTQERLVGLMCEECGKCCKSKAGLVAHRRVHVYESLVKPRCLRDWSSIFLVDWLSASKPGYGCLTGKHNRTKQHLMALTKLSVTQRSEANDYSVWFNQTVDCVVSHLESHADSSLDISTRLENCISTPSSASLSGVGQLQVDPPSQLRRHPDPIPQKMARCSVCCARWVVEGSMQRKLESAADKLGRAGMKVNALKTKAMVICGDRKHQATAVLVEPFCFTKELITPLGPTDTVTYLGIPFSFKWKGVINHRQYLFELLDEVMRAPLKPNQRTKITKNYLIPRLTYQFVLGQVHRNTLKRLDYYIRQSIRDGLRLPKDIHAAAKTAYTYSGYGCHIFVHRWFKEVEVNSYKSEAVADTTDAPRVVARKGLLEEVGQLASGHVSTPVQLTECGQFLCRRVISSENRSTYFIITDRVISSDSDNHPKI
ncbi:retrovirus-related Pol polyprotein from type-2 retrotransposable element R2DM [Clonorchis sinensis]|uniref:Retrovirus-related Pol polyprotein from type-2 retrotransposable element R2DM n=1 Tax=Clonorchis sinensis TaxID=79923 RepID=G7YS15_CLOSI|nr:retrovirus-related Pol polyprotein from type-2 retrotransposable element R2DM [Clonorchis sinensis]